MHIMTGKAVFRRLYGAFFVLTSAYRASSYQEDPEIQLLLDQAEEFYSSVLRDEATQMLNYHLIVSKAKVLIKAGLTVCWMMHLQAVSNCCLVFAAAGYFNYLRSAYNYLQ
ncbi:hypothetical protein DPMN_114967 [Dreissena polymorpha]|uniref:Uncharacterized protein n=1 Tax=Dreissena polymorpha TaxID=45954 RepID=A0A9D4QSY9_DREPO|nr:hypothetical protein DPMN_114967 [Dreissena polymorpha]